MLATSIRIDRFGSPELMQLHSEELTAPAANEGSDKTKNLLNTNIDIQI